MNGGRPALKLPPLAWWVVAITLCVQGGCRRRSLLPRGEGEAVVVMEPDAGPPAGAALPTTNEHEPNNTAAQAERVYLAPWPLLPGAPVGSDAAAAATASWAVQAQLAAGGDVDTYRLTLVPAEGFAADAGAEDAGAGKGSTSFASVAIELTPGSAGLTNAVVLEGRLVNGGRVVQLSSKGERVAVPNAGLLAGADLLLTVSRATRRGAEAVPYTLSVVAASPQAGDELEPNGQPAQATAIASSTATLEAVGYLGWRQDTDWFAITFPALPADSALSIDLQLPADGVALLAVGGDSEGKPSYGYTRGVPDKLQLRSVGVPPTGPLLVKVQNLGPPVLLQKYRLTIAAVPLGAGAELEPNDQSTSATDASASRLSGFIHPAGDVDSFKVCQRGGMTFSVESPPRLDLVVNVTDAAGAQVLSFTAGPGKTGQSSPLPSAECFFIQIRDKTGKASNSLEPYSVVFGG